MTEQAPGVIAPQYSGLCGLCRKTGGHTLVVHAWPKTMQHLFRTKLNSTKLFPQPETCEEHRTRLMDIAQLFLHTQLPQLAKHFDTLGRDAPDMGDILFDVVTTEHATGLSADADAASPADGYGTILRPELVTPHL